MHLTVVVVVAVVDAAVHAVNFTDPSELAALTWMRLDDAVDDDARPPQVRSGPALLARPRISRGR